MYAPDAKQRQNGLWYMCCLNEQGDVESTYLGAAYEDYTTAQQAAEEAIWYAELNHISFHKAAHIIAWS